MNGLPNETARTEDFEFAALNEAKNYRAALLREFSEHLRGHVLEVGAGIGQITADLLRNASITRLLSIEPDPKFCAGFRAALPGRDLLQGTIEDLKNDDPWNVILSINVLEHISADEREPGGGGGCVGWRRGRLADPHSLGAAGDRGTHAGSLRGFRLPVGRLQPCGQGRRPSPFFRRRTVCDFLLSRRLRGISVARNHLAARRLGRLCRAVDRRTDSDRVGRLAPVERIHLHSTALFRRGIIQNVEC